MDHIFLTVELIVLGIGSGWVFYSEQLEVSAKSGRSQVNTPEIESLLGDLLNQSCLGLSICREIASFHIATPKTQNITGVQVDAKTGKIVSTRMETPSKQAKEAQSEK